MTFVVTENCIKCKYMDCVEVCPVDCFHEGPNFLVIDPDECIDCTLCEPECPAEAIYSEEEIPQGPGTVPQAQRRARQELAGHQREEAGACGRRRVEGPAGQAVAAGALSLSRLAAPRLRASLSCLDEFRRREVARQIIAAVGEDAGRAADAELLAERVGRARPACSCTPCRRPRRPAWRASALPAGWPSTRRPRPCATTRCPGRCAGRTGSAPARRGGCTRRSRCAASGSTGSRRR